MTHYHNRNSRLRQWNQCNWKHLTQLAQFYAILQFIWIWSLQLTHINVTQLNANQFNILWVFGGLGHKGSIPLKVGWKLCSTDSHCISIHFLCCIWCFALTSMWVIWKSCAVQSLFIRKCPRQGNYIGNRLAPTWQQLEVLIDSAAFFYQHPRLKSQPLDITDILDLTCNKIPNKWS